MNKSKSNIIEQLYTDCFDELVLYVFGLIGNYHDAQDIVSEIFLEQIKYEPAKTINFENIKTECEIKSKIYACYKEIKPEKFSLVSKDPLDIMLENESRYTLEKYIINLGRTYSRVLELYYLREMRLCEISKVLSVNQSTVSHKVRRGRVILKNRLIKKGYR